MTDWRVFHFSALDHVNVVEGEEIIPGGPTRQWIEDMREFHREGSPIYDARVLGRFPRDDVRGVFKREWWETATDNWKRRAFFSEFERAEPLLAVDVARYGDDSTCIAIRRGPRLMEFVTWSKCDTVETVERIGEVAKKAGLERRRPGLYGPGYGRMIVDAVTMPGVCDQLKRKERWRVTEHKGSRKARDPTTYENRRTECYWLLRKKMQDGEISLPDDGRLWEELQAVRYEVSNTGKIKLERKKDLKRSLGWSPDRADALSMVFGGAKEPGGGTALLAGI